MHSDTKLHPYLNFKDQTKAAMTFYQSVLGGTLTMQTYAEAHMGDSTALIIHAELTNDFCTFFSSDGGEDHPVVIGTNVHMSLMGSDDALLTKFFNGLAEGGKVDMPLAKQFWGDTYGQLTDKFGVHWMVNIAGAKPQK